MIKAFKIFKEGTTTNGPVWITYKKGTEFDIEKKMAFYKELGYTITF